MRDESQSQTAVISSQKADPMNKVSNHLSLFAIRERLIFEVASPKTLSVVSDSLSPNTHLPRDVEFSKTPHATGLADCPTFAPPHRLPPSAVRHMSHRGRITLLDNPLSVGRLEPSFRLGCNIICRRVAGHGVDHLRHGHESSHGGNSRSPYSSTVSPGLRWSAGARGRMRCRA